MWLSFAKLQYNMKSMFILFSILQCVFSDIKVDPLVEANVGLIRGLAATDGDYSMFLGIPYAKVDEVNPFGASIPITHFDDVFEAYEDSKPCPQLNFANAIIGELDCLHLNIYVPKKASSNNKLPAMIWIHGGWFANGDAGRHLYGPKFLMKQNVILVTINYRLGPYGFMCLNIPEVPGNQGLKDQFLAFEWIRDNIAAFGGDIERITLFGESAGGHSIDLHLMSFNDNLFSNIILQSGSSLAATVLEETTKDAPIILASQLGYLTENINEALKFLSSVDPHLIIAAATETNSLFKPCVEQEFDDVKAFITSPWINATMPKVRGIPILIGFNNKERLFDYINKNENYYENLKVFQNVLKQTFDFDEDQLIEMEKTVRHFYIADHLITKESQEAIADFDSDYTYIHPIQRRIKDYIENEAKSVYYYMFSYSGKRNFMQNLVNVTFKGAFHADELGYLFTSNGLSEVPSLEDQKMIERMTTMWANFAKHSDPTPDITDLLPVKWAPVNDDNLFYLNIDSELSLNSRPLHDRMAFWNLFYRLNGKSQKCYLKRIPDLSQKGYWKRNSDL